MVNKWPFIAVASVLNSLLATAAFINFKLHIITITDPPHAGGGLLSLYSINPALFAAGMFVCTFGVIVAIARLVTGIMVKLHVLNKHLANVQPTAANPLDVA